MPTLKKTNQLRAQREGGSLDVHAYVTEGRLGVNTCARMLAVRRLSKSYLKGGLTASWSITKQMARK